MTTRSLAVVGNTVHGTCPLYHGNTQGSEDFTGVWGSIPLPDRHITAQGTPIVLVGDTGNASCGHTFVAIDGGIAQTRGIQVHRTGDNIGIVENSPTQIVGQTDLTISRCTSN